MIFPIQEIQGIGYNEHLNLNNALKILNNWDGIINKLPDERKRKIEEKCKQFDFLISLKTICIDFARINHQSIMFHIYHPKISKIWDDYLHNLYRFKIYRKNLEWRLGQIVTI